MTQTVCQVYNCPFLQLLYRVLPPISAISSVGGPAPPVRSGTRREIFMAPPTAVAPTARVRSLRWIRRARDLCFIASAPQALPAGTDNSPPPAWSWTGQATCTEPQPAVQTEWEWCSRSPRNSWSSYPCSQPSLTWKARKTWAAFDRAQQSWAARFFRKSQPKTIERLGHCAGHKRLFPAIA